MQLPDMTAWHDSLKNKLREGSCRHISPCIRCWEQMLDYMIGPEPATVSRSCIRAIS